MSESSQWGVISGGNSANLTETVELLRSTIAIGLEMAAGSETILRALRSHPIILTPNGTNNMLLTPLDLAEVTEMLRNMKDVALNLTAKELLAGGGQRGGAEGMPVTRSNHTNRSGRTGF